MLKEKDVLGQGPHRSCSTPKPNNVSLLEKNKQEYNGRTVRPSLRAAARLVLVQISLRSAAVKRPWSSMMWPMREIVAKTWEAG